MAGASSGVQVIGLDSLIAALRLIPEEIAEEIVWELEEAADPVRKASTEYILSGGGGFPAMHNMPPTPVYAAMRIGVSRQEKMVWVAPAWKSSGAGSPRWNIAFEFRGRMEAALEDNTEEVYEKVDKMIDRIATHHGF